jgi:hypothetical protein
MRQLDRPLRFWMNCSILSKMEKDASLKISALRTRLWARLFLCDKTRGIPEMYLHTKNDINLEFGIVKSTLSRLLKRPSRPQMKQSVYLFELD